MKIVRKESKETVYWLKVIQGSNDLFNELKQENEYLIDEAEQLQRVLSAIVNKLKQQLTKLHLRLSHVSGLDFGV